MPTPFKGKLSDLEVIARQKCEERRARVLAQPDIAKRLCDPPYRASSPGMWTGYIPPAQINGDKVNRSPIRAQLVDIVRAVSEAEEQAADEPDEQETEAS